MKFCARFFSSFYLSLFCVGVSNNVLAMKTEKPERWFEIEVIIFNQLSDKKGLKEQFSDNNNSTNLPQYTKYFDLLTPYLQPDLTSIKQFIPLCSQDDQQDGYQSAWSEVKSPLFDAISALGDVATFSMPEFPTENKVILQQTQNPQAAIELNQHEPIVAENTSEYLASDEPQSFIENTQDVLNLSQQRKLAVERKKALESPLYSTQTICVISRKDIEGLFNQEQIETVQIDSFNVEYLPSRLNAAGSHNSETPYLIANESLLLSEINQRLLWSREFKPLLHFGWRQVGITQEEAIPLKLFAGEHLDFQYQQAFKNYQSAIKEKKAKQSIFHPPETVEEQMNNDNNEVKQPNRHDYAEVNQQKLTEIFSDFSSIDGANNGNLVRNIKHQTFEELISVNVINGQDGEQLNLPKPPEKPLQPWFLDGFIKVHLDHYLYITADFNVLSQSKNNYSTNDERGNTIIKLINFSQNKRAITGEIHYFDHPYIGMIVQIRRFDPSKPKDEAVTQVIN